MSTTEQPSQYLLTERNLRLNSAIHVQASRNMEASAAEEPTRTKSSELSYQYNLNDCDGSDEDEMHDIALRRAASLEALQAYGGCFVSGFLAMQDPLPWISTSTIGTTSNTSTSSAGSPRPDSDTLSITDVQELTGRRTRSWKSLGRLRSAGRKSKK